MCSQQIKMCTPLLEQLFSILILFNLIFIVNWMLQICSISKETSSKLESKYSLKKLFLITLTSSNFKRYYVIALKFWTNRGMLVE